MATPFRHVVCLWVLPDFSEVEAGRSAPPWINHDDVDFDALGREIERWNDCGERVRIRMPNDTIDQVTIHARLRGKDRTLVACEDFAHALLKAARGAKPVIPIRDAWKPLHFIKTRDRAPPPVAIMFVVEGGFQTVQIWMNQACLHLGMRSADMDRIMRNVVTDSDHEGALPADLQRVLEKAFGVPFLKTCQLRHTMAHGPFPTWAREYVDGVAAQ